MLDFINYPVSGIMWVWHKVFGALFGASSGIAWALSIMFLVFTLRAILFKPFVKYVRSMKQMQEFAPQMQKLREKYGNDRQRLAAEMQKLQSEHGFNPLGGCLPMLVQIPVFFGLTNVLQGFQANATKNFFFGAEEVKSYLAAKLFGANFSSSLTAAAETLGQYGTVRADQVAVTIPIMIVASALTHLTSRHSVARQNPAAANQQTAIMNKLALYVFPLGVLVAGLFLPMGMLLYWLSNNLWTLMQQYVVYHRIDREEEQKKQDAISKRQNLAPKPGQKPSRKRPAADTTADTTAKAEGDDTDAETEKPAANGSAPKKDSTRPKPGTVPGIIDDRSRGKKQSRKRR
ncbi:membrane protein insertase YidC [Allokutzneria sp. A3M-2-11 16]|uniref:membrane protein insertase YidC n=1 Tax=Allokutzneria sp. A3M-2-11 16 TaxID=2962043 RepID=UPI0020B70C22|nr:membrane protein insertase YidC [Allokutzneria sp. A3M-2-11 16]MCP3799504.1 membrane protein insertase YidC [Allokutzneria sp. A3M-2-11 16]